MPATPPDRATEDANRFFSAPILNSPYEYPTQQELERFLHQNGKGIDDARKYVQ